MARRCSASLIIIVNRMLLAGSLIVVSLAGCSAVGASEAPLPEATPPSDVDEAQLLLAFKKGIVSDPFGRLASWTVSHNSSVAAAPHPCTAAWSGIVCDAHKRHVTGINLASSNLSGSISPSLALLPALSDLDLSDNSLYGGIPNSLFLAHSALQHLNLSFNLINESLPDSFANLSALLTLDLSYNHFVGGFPPSLSQCQSLETLYLKEAGLTGRIPPEIWQLPALIKLKIFGTENSVLQTVLPQKFVSCPTLRALALSDVDATGSAFPSSLGDCKQLQDLVLDVIGLEGTIPAEIWQLPSLGRLVVSDSQVQDAIDGQQGWPFKLHGSLPSSVFPFCHTIEVLEIDGVNLTGEIPSYLGQCSSLSVLDLSHGRLQGAIPPALGNLSNLEVLHLQSQRLTGTIPKEPFQCSGLQSIRLGDNANLTGAIPKEVGKLKQLVALSLYTTSLRGPVPEELCNCTALEWLDVGWARQDGVGKLPNCLAKLAQLQTLAWQFNAIHEEVPMRVLKNLTQLQYLDMSWCALVGRIPPELGNLSYLHHLGFRENNLMGPIPLELAQLPLLESLDLTLNSLSGSLSEHFFLSLANGSSITQLSVSNNRLHGVIPGSIGGLQTLRVLYLSNNMIGGGIPSGLGNCSALEDLDLQSNSLQGGIPATLGRLSRLNQNLQLSKNQLSGGIPKELGTLALLKVLDLSRNKLTGHVPSKSLENCTNLQILRLFQNNLNGRIEQFDLSKLQNLITFTLQQNNFTGDLPGGFTSSRNLQLFDVRRNSLSGTLPSDHPGIAGFTGLTHLRVLVLGYNRLSGEIPGWLWNLPMLQVLDLSNNGFSGSMPTTVTHLDYFKQDQSRNSTQSTLYEEVEETVKFTFQINSYILNTRIVFDVSMNSLEGMLSQSFGELLGLTSLNLSHNRIQGNIPKSLGNLHSLDQLDLSHNHLTGRIPDELGALGTLSVVDLSYNDLQGPIPSTNFFNTRYNYTSFEGNPGLCGPPLVVNHSCEVSIKPPITYSKSEPHAHHAWSFIKWIDCFASPWALLIAYLIGFFGGLGVLYCMGIIPRHQKQKRPITI